MGRPVLEADVSPSLDAGATTGTRALIICSEQPPTESGVARAIASVSDGLRRRGHHVDVVTGGDARYFSLGEFRFNTLALQWRRVHATLRDYDVINIHGPAPTISDAYLGLLRTVPRAHRPRVLYTHHFSIELDQWHRATRVYDAFHRRVARLADEIIVSSPSYQQLLSSRHGPPVRLIPWGVDLQRFSGRRTAPPYDGSRPLRLLFVGQMRPYKGIAEIIQAVSGSPELHLTVVGKGRLEGQYRELASGTTARFVGSVSDEELTRLYLDHDVVVKASTNKLEAFGLVLVEGMAAGCVPVTSDLPGVSDVARPTGRIVRAGDVEDLRRALLDLAANPPTVRELGARSRVSARSYDWSRTVEQYERAFLAPLPEVIDLTDSVSAAEDAVPLEVP